ncbi:MAG: SLC26A/SulP transporter family protein [Halioglobus sp.]|nr:SLC26A/SulP transporter family protein [Halioglobus sp.]
MLREFNAERVIAILLAGIIAGLVTLITSVSFAALMFNGKLAPFISSGITILIATAVVGGSIFSLFSSCRPLVAMPDDDTAPILALMVTMVVAGFPAGTPAEVLFVTAYGALACTAVLTGLALALLGIFRLGSLVRFLPYSVMGGYFAGAGLLLIQGALRVVSDLPLQSAADFMGLVEPDILWRWLPAVLAAAFIRWAILHWFKSLAMPAAIFVLLGVFFATAALLGLSPSELMADGWLVGPFPESQPTLWNPVLLERSADIDWTLVVQHLASIGTITMLSAVSLMLTASGLSVLLRDNVDINRELTVAGAANAISGVSGGLLALPSMTLTDLAVTVGAPKSRLVGLVVALFCALALFFGMSLIAWFPKAVLAGLLLFLGWSLLERWLIEARSQLPALEYLVVVIIVLVVASVGFIQGVLVGLMGAIMLFVINYSRINVVRYALTGAERRSNVERNLQQEKYLREHGGQTLILKLQGYLFFGTAAALVSRIEARLNDKALPPLAYVALDFSQVTDMDSSAALSFMKLAQEATKSHFFLLLTGLPSGMGDRLMGSWFEKETSSYIQIMPDLDRGIEWCEERMLREQALEDDHLGIMEQLATYLPAPGDHLILAEYFEHRVVEPGDVLAEQGAPSDEMFLLQSCSASVYLDAGSGTRHRIRRADSGTVFGEVGFYLGTPRTASVIVDNGGDLYVLCQAANARLEQEHPQIAGALHKFMIRVITRRLQLTTTTLQAVLT